MDFAELVELLRNPGEDGLPETIYDDLTGAYNSVVDGALAKDTAHGEAVQSLQAEISALKAQNFDLLMAVSSGSSGEESADSDEQPEDDAPDNIDSLFG